MPAFPCDYAYMSVFNRLISKELRQLCILSTVGYEYVMRFEDDLARWAARHPKEVDIVFKEHDEGAAQRKYHHADVDHASLRQ